MMKNGYYKHEYGTQEWYLNGYLHREDGPAIIRVDGTKKWYINGIRHREDGPAYIGADGHQVWWVNDELHREDGPARIWADGSHEWWVNSKAITDQVNKWLDDYSLTYDTLTDEEKWYLIFYIRSLMT